MNKQIKFIDIVGARPQFIKLAAMLRAMDDYNKDNPDKIIKEILIHTGQHYDYEMSGIFFEELGLKSPNYHLGVGSGTHGYQTGEMIKRIELVLIEEEPDLVIVYGDTNSTLAGAIAAAKLNIPIAHVEAGLRSFNKNMPEEINRILTDRISDFLFCPSETAVENLKGEGFINIINRDKLFEFRTENSEIFSPYPLVINVGDVMYDAALLYLDLAEKKSNILNDLNIKSKKYALATIHRAENTDEPERLKAIFSGLEAIVQNGLTVILPLHPRTRKQAEAHGLLLNGVLVLEPLSYLDMLVLEKNARVILTDSGGIQKEAFFFRVPCVTLREETEWVETVELRWNMLVGFNLENIVISVLNAKEGDKDSQPYGYGKATEYIIKYLIAALSSKYRERV